MIDSRIPMMVQTPNILAAMASGTENAANQANVMRTAELQNLYRQQGPGIMAGDPAAFNALARIDAPGAVGLRTSMNEDRRADAQLDIDRQTLKLRADQVARGLAEAENQAAAMAEAQEFNAAATGILSRWAAGDKEGFAQAASELLGYQITPDENGLAMFGTTFEGVKTFLSAVPEEKTPLVDFSGANIGVQAGGEFQLVDEKKGILAVADPAAPNGVRYVNVPGGPADMEARANQTDAMQETGKSQERDRQQNLKLGTTLTSIGLNIREIEDGGIPVTGPVGAVAGSIPGTPAADFRNRTEQISTSAALSEVQNMRDNSPTGGAVGQLTDSEREAIGMSVTALNNSSSAQEYVRAARAYRDLMLNIAHGEGNWTLNEATNEVSVKPTQQGPNAARVTNDAEYNALPSGSVFIAPDGTMRRKP